MFLVILLLIAIVIVAFVVAARDRHLKVDSEIADLRAQVEELKRQSPPDD